MRYETRYEKVTVINGYKYLNLKTGRRVSFFDAQKEASLFHTHLVRWMSRMVKLASDKHEYDWEAIERMNDQLEALIHWFRVEAEKHTKRKTKEQRIAQLRNTAGRTPEEKAAYLAKADQLEQELLNDR